MSARAFLRPPVRRDRGEFLGRVRASRTLHHPWAYPPADDEAFAAFLDRARRADDVSLVCRIDDGAIAGVVNVSNIVRGAFKNATLGYYGFVPFDGQGLMSEGLTLAVRRAFGELGLHRLEANIQPGNDRSIALVRRIGFRYEGFSPRMLKIGGRWRDHERWAVLAEEFGRSGRSA
jgi:[ribosomal protein S5]-alanine N-acetyltransferase